MKLDYTESSLVVIGGWNPHIFNPIWIQRNLYEPPLFDNESEKNFSVDMDTMSFTDNGVKVIYVGNKLQFHLDGENDFALLEKYALKIFRLLPTTLVIGYGANFHFYGEKESVGNIINTEIFSQLNSRLSSKQCILTFDLGDMRMTISHNIGISDGVSVIAFNFHFNIGGLSEVEPLLSKYSLPSLKDKAIEVLSGVYGLEVEV